MKESVQIPLLCRNVAMICNKLCQDHHGWYQNWWLHSWTEKSGCSKYAWSSRWEAPVWQTLQPPAISRTCPSPCWLVGHPSWWAPATTLADQHFHQVHPDTSLPFWAGGTKARRERALGFWRCLHLNSEVFPKRLLIEILLFPPVSCALFPLYRGVMGQDKERKDFFSAPRHLQAGQEIWPFLREKIGEPPRPHEQTQHCHNPLDAPPRPGNPEPSPGWA